MLTYAIYIFFSGFSLFLLGMSIFMYHEGRKFEDNQFTIKLLPPPPKLSEAETMRTQTVIVSFTSLSGYASQPGHPVLSPSR